MENNNNNNNLINTNLTEEDDDDTNSVLSDFSFDEDIIRIPIINQIFTTCLCNFAYFLHFLPSLIYNMIWLFIFNTIAPNNKEKDNQKNFHNCIDLFGWEKKIIFISKLMFTKELIFMFISFFGNNDNDFYFIWMIIKYLIGLFCSIPFGFYLNKFLNNYNDQNSKIENDNNKEKYCKVLFSNLKAFYNIEIFLIKIICFFIFLIFVVVCLLMIKEYWKGRRYIIR